MTVKQLKAMLEKMPDNLPVVTTQKEMSHYYQCDVRVVRLTTDNKGKEVAEII